MPAARVMIAAFAQALRQRVSERQKPGARSWRMSDLSDFPIRAFAKADPSPDALFYAEPRFVTHIDDRAIRAVTQVYRELLPANGRVLDLMSSWISHLPKDVTYAEVVGLGLSEPELSRNTRLARHFVHDLNRDTTLPLEDACFDAACCCVSVQYLERPVAVLREVRRVLKPGAPVVITFSDRCFPSKAVLIWQAQRHRPGRPRLTLSRPGRVCAHRGPADARARPWRRPSLGRSGAGALTPGPDEEAHTGLVRSCAPCPLRSTLRESKPVLYRSLPRSWEQG